MQTSALLLDPHSVPQRVPPLAADLIISVLQNGADILLTPKIAEGPASIFLRAMALLILFQGLNATLKYVAHKSTYLNVCIQVKSIKSVWEKSPEIFKSIPETILCLLEPTNQQICLNMMGLSSSAQIANASWWENNSSVWLSLWPEFKARLWIH